MHTSGSPGLVYSIGGHQPRVSISLLASFVIQLTSYLRFQSFTTLCNDRKQWNLVELDERGLKPSSIIYKCHLRQVIWLLSLSFFQCKMRSSISSWDYCIRCDSSSDLWQDRTKTVHLLYAHSPLLTEHRPLWFWRSRCRARRGTVSRAGTANLRLILRVG